MMRFGTADADVMGPSPQRTHGMLRCDSPGSSDGGSPPSLPSMSVWPARLPGAGLVCSPSPLPSLLYKDLQGSVARLPCQASHLRSNE